MLFEADMDIFRAQERSTLEQHESIGEEMHAFSSDTLKTMQLKRKKIVNAERLREDGN